MSFIEQLYLILMRSLTHKYIQSFKLKVGYREREIERERSKEGERGRSKIL